MSDYVPTDWVDDVTPVDAARMDKIEQGIDVNRDAVISLDTRLDAVEPALAGKEDKSAKGAANGYAPLGADSKVPALYLPAAGGSIDYENAWAAGTAYTPGDVVIHNGVEYIAVNPSTGQTPPPSPAPSLPPGVIALVTTLPPAPFDGQEVDFTDSLTTPSYVWRFRYVAAAPSNKWKFVGGPRLIAQIATQEGCNNTAYIDLATVGPAITAPLTGVYEINLGVNYWITAEAASVVRAAVKIGAAATSDADGAWENQPTGGTSIANATALTRQPFQKAVAAGDVVKLQYRRDTLPGTAWFSSRQLTLLPVAVS